MTILLRVLVMLDGSDRTREEVDGRLLLIMKDIHKACLDAAEAYGKKGDYVAGANIAGFVKVAKAMMAYGVV